MTFHHTNIPGDGDALGFDFGSPQMNLLVQRHYDMFADELAAADYFDMAGQHTCLMDLLRALARYHWRIQALKHHEALEVEVRVLGCMVMMYRKAMEKRPDINVLMPMLENLFAAISTISGIDVRLDSMDLTDDAGSSPFTPL